MPLPSVRSSVQPLPVDYTSLQQAITAVLVTMVVVDPNARLLLMLWPPLALKRAKARALRRLPVTDIELIL